MTPLCVTADLSGPIGWQWPPLALDALLASQVALGLGLPPPRDASDCQPIEIPVEREPGGRFHLCSFAELVVEGHELRYVNRRAPVEQYQTLGEARIRRVRINAGPDKSYRIPHDVLRLEADRIRWWCVGEAAEIERLLLGVTHLGKRRAVGLGRVLRWTVAPCYSWGAGFPVARDGKPLRSLPQDWPGLVAPHVAHVALTYPYWDHLREEPCAVPAP